MRKLVLIFAMVGAGFPAGAQEVLTMPVEFLPQRGDTMARSTKEVYVFASLSYYVPNTKEGATPFQKKAFGPKPKASSRLFRAKMEMLFFAPRKHDSRFELHGFCRVDAYPMHYVSSRFGCGVSYRPFGLSGGFFIGNYYRWVPSDGNFVTRRARQFDSYPLNGFYLQAGNEGMSLFFAYAKERYKAVITTRAAIRVGRIFGLGNSTARLRTLELVGSSEEFAGAGVGFSLEVIPHLRGEVQWVTPSELDRNELARLGYKMPSGLMASVACYLD